MAVRLVAAVAVRPVPAVGVRSVPAVGVRSEPVQSDARSAARLAAVAHPGAIAACAKFPRLPAQPCVGTPRSEATDLLACRPTKISASDPASTCWPGER